MINVQKTKQSQAIRRSPLTLSIMLALGSFSAAQAAETVAYPGTGTIHVCGGSGRVNALTTQCDTNGTISITNNSVTLGTLGANPAPYAVYGAYREDSANASANQVYINDNVTTNVYGARVYTGNAIGNTVTINSGDINDNAYGGFSDQGTVSGNTVNFKGGSVTNNIFGGYSEKNAVSDNIVNFTNGSANDSIYGGYNYSDKSITNNSVTVTGGSVFRDIKGGETLSGNVVGNSVTTDNISTGGNAYGGYTYNGNATGNRVSISGTTATVKAVTGGLSINGFAKDNNVTINDATINSHVNGGESKGDGENNSVTINNGTITTSVKGSTQEGTGINNKVSINNGTIGSQVFGSYSSQGDAIGNIVVINSGSIGEDVFGGYGYKNATGNTVIIKDGTIGRQVYGGYGLNDVSVNTVTMTGGTVNGNVFGGEVVASSNAKANKVNISGGTINNSKIYGGSSYKGDAIDNNVTISNSANLNASTVYGGRSSLGNTTGNSVNINGGSVGLVAIGGLSEGDGNTTNNSVIINAGSVGQAVAGGFNTGSGNAKGNTITINSGSVSGFVAGGFSSAGDSTDNAVTINAGNVSGNVFGGRAVTGNATTNTINITGGMFSGNVYGGYAMTGNGNATNNTVTVSGTPTFAPTTVLNGGGTLPSPLGTNLPSTGDLFSGNTLNINNRNITVNDVKNFEHYKFHLDGKGSAGNNTFLNLTTTGNTNLSRSDYKIVLQDGPLSIRIGDEAVLINSAGNVSINPAIKSTTAKKGISTLVDIGLFVRGNNQLVASVATIYINPQTKALLESGLAMTDFVNRGIDLADGVGFDALRDSQAANTMAFGAISAGKYTSDTGSHIDVSGAEFIVGVGKNFDNSAGNLSIGGFAEFGTGSYEAHNDSDGMPDVDSSGSAKYYGLGVMAKQEFISGLSLKGGMSFGRTDSDFDSTELTNFKGQGTSFETNRDYFSAFAGVGYDVAINTSSKVNVYADVKHTNLSGDEQVLLGDTFHFDEINSTRTTLGARWSKKINADGNVYAGAAWEHEFDGTASGNVNNMDIPEPSLEGDTGIFEAGFEFNPANNKNLNITIGAQGTVGKRQGASANASFQYNF